jgi:transposase InsO family protein
MVYLPEENVILEIQQKVTTNRPIAANILNQNFKVSRANQVWVSDVTYIENK